MTEAGGTSSAGTIFMMTPAGAVTVLHAFTGGTDGKFPFGGLVRDATGNLYGTSAQGGSGGCYTSGCGTVFKLTP